MVHDLCSQAAVDTVGPGAGSVVAVQLFEVAEQLRRQERPELATGFTNDGMQVAVIGGGVDHRVGDIGSRRRAAVDDRRRLGVQGITDGVALVGEVVVLVLVQQIQAAGPVQQVEAAGITRIAQVQQRVGEGHVRGDHPVARKRQIGASRVRIQLP